MTLRKTADGFQRHLRHLADIRIVFSVEKSGQRFGMMGQ